MLTGRLARGVKRIADVLLAGTGMVVLSPIVLTAAAAIGVTMGRPILFRQRRAGFHGEPFLLYKFRTMSGSPIPGREAEDDHIRLTRLGRTLRRLSIDELPQLWNVLAGDMSLIGPRPLLLDYLPLYSPEQARRHLAKPGITGWAQVNGRNAIDWETRLALDAWYVDNWSLALDVRIFFDTLRQLARGSETSAPNHATMPRFAGTPTARREADGPHHETNR